MQIDFNKVPLGLQQVSALTDKLTWVKYNDFKKEHREKEKDFSDNSQRLEGMQEREAARVQPRK